MIEHSKHGQLSAPRSAGKTGTLARETSVHLAQAFQPLCGVPKTALKRLFTPSSTIPSSFARILLRQAYIPTDGEITCLYQVSIAAENQFPELRQC